MGVKGHEFLGFFAFINVKGEFYKDLGLASGSFWFLICAESLKICARGLFTPRSRGMSVRDVCNSTLQSLQSLMEAPPVDPGVCGPVLTGRTLRCRTFPKSTLGLHAVTGVSTVKTASPTPLSPAPSLPC